MSTTTTPSEIWDNILKDNVGKDDPLWKEYLDKAAAFDVRMVDEWNKIVDVLLVYVALFISVLTSFIIQTFPHFQRNPADITNDLLVAILLAQSNNTSISPVDPLSYFQQPEDKYHDAVVQNALLYTSLLLSVIVSAIALVAKLWLVRYSHQVFSDGSPYDRAMKRQEAYSGVLVWHMGAVINLLPVILLVALYLFGIYVYLSVYPVQVYIGVTIGALLSVGVLFLGFSSLAGAFVPGCPFRSGFSDVIQFIFEIIRTSLKWVTSRCGWQWLRWLPSKTLSSITHVVWLSILLAPSILVMAFALRFGSSGWISLLLFPATMILFAYSAQLEVVHKPQKYKISALATPALIIFLVWTISSFIYQVSSHSFSLSTVSTVAYYIALSGLYFVLCIFSQMSKSTADTGEIDAIAWLLITASPQHPATYFKKAGQMTGLDSIGRDYRPRLLESLMPLLTLLITSHHVPQHHTSDTHSPPSEPRRNFKIELKREQSSDEVLDGRYRLPISLSLMDDTSPIDEDPHLKNLEIYTACLARLSDFADFKGSLRCLREDARQHPKLEQPLIDKLVEFANPRHHYRVGLRSAATKVLKNYELDTDGIPVKSSVSTFVNSTAPLMLNMNGLNNRNSEQGHPNLHRPADADTHVEPAISSGDIEEVKPEIGGPEMC